MTAHGRDALRTVWLFGKPYWWDQLDDGRLTLRPDSCVTPSKEHRR